MKTRQYSLLIIACFLLILTPTAFSQMVKGKHLKNGLTCVQCHGIAAPTGPANQEACIKCHGDMVEGKLVIFEEKGHKKELNPHDSHESPIDCTNCHAAHKPTRLYCNDCHAFTNTVP